MAVNAEWLHFAQVIILSLSVHLSNLVSLDAQVQKRRVTTDFTLTLTKDWQLSLLFSLGVELVSRLSLVPRVSLLKRGAQWRPNIIPRKLNIIFWICKSLVGFNDSFLMFLLFLFSCSVLHVPNLFCSPCSKFVLVSIFLICFVLYIPRELAVEQYCSLLWGNC